MSAMQCRPCGKHTTERAGHRSHFASKKRSGDRADEQREQRTSVRQRCAAPDSAFSNDNGDPIADPQWSVIQHAKSPRCTAEQLAHRIAAATSRLVAAAAACFIHADLGVGVIKRRDRSAGIDRWRRASRGLRHGLLPGTTNCTQKLTTTDDPAPCRAMA